jgi:Domain of unknown function (DUF4387)
VADGVMDHGAPSTLGAVARLIRSKNAGPFWITIDVFFHCDEDYAAYHDEITAARIAAIYGVDPTAVRVFGIPQLRVTKISFPRPVPQGGPLDRDIHAGQQFVPLSGAPLFHADASTSAEWAEGSEQLDTIAL